MLREAESRACATRETVPLRDVLVAVAVTVAVAVAVAVSVAIAVVVVFFNSPMAAWSGPFCFVLRPQSYQRPPFRTDMTDCKFIEQFRLSRARIEYLPEDLKGELERHTAKSCKE